MITLYDAQISGNCHKVRLLLSFLELEHNVVPVDLKNRQQKTPEFLAMNPFGEVPVLRDGDLVLRDSQAIVVYLAKRYAGDTWLPNDARDLGKVMQWISTAANDIANGPTLARAYHLFGRKEIDIEKAMTRSLSLFEVMDGHLKSRLWLELERPTIADVACYPYIALAHEGKLSCQKYPNLYAWLDRFQRIPGFVSMPGIVVN